MPSTYWLLEDGTGVRVLDDGEGAWLLDDVTVIRWVLTTTTRPGPRPRHKLFRYFNGVPIGVSLLKIDGIYVSIVEPSDAEIASASEYYRGGYAHVVTEAKAAELLEAGFTVESAYAPT